MLLTNSDISPTKPGFSYALSLRLQVVCTLHDVQRKHTSVQEVRLVSNCLFVK